MVNSHSSFLHLGVMRLSSEHHKIIVYCTNARMHIILDLTSLDSVEQHIPECSTSGELEDCTISLEHKSPISRSSTSDSESQANNTHWQGFVRLLKKGMPFQSSTTPPKSVPFTPPKSLPVTPPKSVPKLTRRHSKRFRVDEIPIINSPPLSPSPLKAAFSPDLYCFRASWKNFSLAEIMDATNDFSPGKSSFS